VYNLSQQKVRNAEALAFNKNTDGSRKSSLPNYKVIPVHFYGLIFFITYVSKHSPDILWGCFCKETELLI